MKKYLKYKQMFLTENMSSDILYTNTCLEYMFELLVVSVRKDGCHESCGKD